MQLKDPFETKLCTLKFIILSTVAALAVSLSKIDSEEELGDWCKSRSEDRDVMKMQLPHCEAYGKVDEYEREEQELARQRKCMAVLRNDHTRTCRSLNSLTNALPSFLILHYLGSHIRCTTMTGPEACPTPINTNACWFKGYCAC